MLSETNSLREIKARLLRNQGWPAPITANVTSLSQTVCAWLSRGPDGGETYVLLPGAIDALAAAFERTAQRGPAGHAAVEKALTVAAALHGELKSPAACEGIIEALRRAPTALAAVRRARSPERQRGVQAGFARLLGERLTKSAATVDAKSPVDSQKAFTLFHVGQERPRASVATRTETRTSPGGATNRKAPSANRADRRTFRIH